MLFDKPYYLVPQKNGEKGYFLLRDALIKTEKVAIGKIVIRTKQHLAAIMPMGEYLILEILRFAHEVKRLKDVDFLDDVKTTGRYNPRELKMAEDLIKGMTAKWKPEKYDDTYFEDMMKLIKKKIKAGKTHEMTEEPEEDEDYSESNVGVADLLPLLRQSLANKGKASKATGKTKTAAKSKAKTKTKKILVKPLADVQRQAKLQKDPRARRRRRAQVGRQVDLRRAGAPRFAPALRFPPGVDGVLKSWAVPKGPSLDPAQKRLGGAGRGSPGVLRQVHGDIPKGSTAPERC